MTALACAEDLSQIDADCLDLPGLRIRARFKIDGLASGDFIAFLQCGDVEENVRTTVILLVNRAHLRALSKAGPVSLAPRH